MTALPFSSGGRISFDANITFPFFSTVLAVGFVCAVGGFGTALGYKFGEFSYAKIMSFFD
jgi:hypothetical protein